MHNLTTALKAAAGNVGAGGETNPNAWDISYSVLDEYSADYYDLTTNVRTATYSVASQEATPRGLSFKSDGTKMYVIGNSGDDVNEYDLSTAWDVSTATYNQVFSVQSQDSAPNGLYFKPDGTKMYIAGLTGDDINEYDLSTAWDVSTASYQQNFSVNAQEATVKGVFFKTDGTRMYICGGTSDNIVQYNLSTAWDISTASYNQSYSLTSPVNIEGNSQDLWFNSDGDKMYICGTSGDGIDEFNLSTAWDISTLSHVSFISTAGTYGEAGPCGLFLKDDGSRVYVVGTGIDTVIQLTLGPAELDISDKETTPTGLWFKTNGTKLYMCGQVSDSIHEYDLSTAWDITSATFNQTRSLKSDNSSFTSPQGLFFKDDGTVFWCVDKSADAVGEYTLSTAWDISTASHSQNFSVAGQEATPNSVYFKTDGTKMYVSGHTGDDVNEYTLSTAWDISTASYSQAFSVVSQEATPTGISFKPDGTKMYITGSSGDDVNEYDLSTAWDVSTASYNQQYRMNLFLTQPHDIYFKPDGTKYYLIGVSTDSIWQFSIRSS